MSASKIVRKTLVCPMQPSECMLKAVLLELYGWPVWREGLWQLCREGLAPGKGTAGASAAPWSRWRPRSSPGSAPAAGGHCSPTAARPAITMHQHCSPPALGLTISPQRSRQCQVYNYLVLLCPSSWMSVIHRTQLRTEAPKMVRCDVSSAEDCWQETGTAPCCQSGSG